MAMHYLIRNQNPEDLSEIKSRVPDLQDQLGPAGEGLRRVITVSFSPLRHAHYTLTTRKKGTDWTWVNPGIELDTADEQGLFTLCDMYKVPHPAHLAGRVETPDA